MNLMSHVLSVALSATVIENVKVEVGDGTVLENAFVVFEAGKIVSVGTGAPAQKDLTHVNGQGKVLTPGLIDSMSQVGLSEVQLESQTQDVSFHHMPLVPGFQAARGFNPLSVWIPVERESGVTTAILVPSGGLLAGEAHVVSLTGALDSMPDVSSPIASVGSVTHGASGDVGGSRGALWLALREVFAEARLYAKNKKAYEENRLRPLRLSQVHLEALQSVLAKKTPLMLEANRASDMLSALSFAKDEGVRLIITGAAEGHLVAAQLKAAKVPVVVTPSNQIPASFDQLYARDDLAGLLDQAGVDVVIAAQDNSHRRLRQEAGIAVAYGLNRSHALATITSKPAAALGLTQVGMVKIGMRADLVLWSGDPLELSTVAEHIFIDGKEQSLETRQGKLVKRYLKK
jgi:imidazolonepropionase-like amidohydrolase